MVSPEMPVSQYTPWQANRAQLLDSTLKMIKNCRSLEERGVKHLEWKDMQGDSKTQLIDKKFIKGLGLIAYSLWGDLKDEGELETADDIITNNNRR